MQNNVTDTDTELIIRLNKNPDSNVIYWAEQSPQAISALIDCMFGSWTTGLQDWLLQRINEYADATGETGTRNLEKYDSIHDVWWSDNVLHVTGRGYNEYCGAEYRLEVSIPTLFRDMNEIRAETAVRKEQAEQAKKLAAELEKQAQIQRTADAERALLRQLKEKYPDEK